MLNGLKGKYRISLVHKANQSAQRDNKVRKSGDKLSCIVDASKDVDKFANKLSMSSNSKK